MKKIISLFLFFSCFKVTFLSAQDSLPNNIPPSVQITRIRIMDKDTALHELYELNHLNKITIYFSSDSTYPLNEIRYKYQMIGIDEEWVETEYPIVQYTNLSPGEYAFIVLAGNKGKWGEQPAGVRFIVRPHYWQTWWFKLIIFDIIVLGLMLFEHLRFKRAMRKEQKKNELEKKVAELELTTLRSQMNPHFIFNALNSIQRFITDNDKASANRYLVDFSKLIRRIIENSQAKTISISEEIDTLKLYLRLEKLRMGENKMEYEINVDPDIDIYNEEVPPLLIQPYVENAIWHGISGLSSKGKVKINLKKENNYIVCSIIDNGIGREKAEQMKSENSKQHKSRGMSFTKERLEILNSLSENQKSIEIFDLHDDKRNPSGTEVKIYISTENN